MLNVRVERIGVHSVLDIQMCAIILTDSETDLLLQAWLVVLAIGVSHQGFVHFIVLHEVA